MAQPADSPARVAEGAAASSGSHDSHDDGFRHGYFDRFEQEHPNIVASKLALLTTAVTLDGTRAAGRTVSIGGGTGSYEAALRRNGIETERIVEPSHDLAQVARERGFEVIEALAQDVSFDDASLDTVFYNGSAFGFIDGDTLLALFRAHHRQLARGGVLALLDVPPASALGVAVQSSFRADPSPYVLETLRRSWYSADTPRKQYWRTTEEYRQMLVEAGFSVFSTWQTLRRHLIYQNDEPEAVVPGHREGSYVALVARR